MEFDKSKVYTAANADELKPGSKVILADTLDDLKAYVDEGNKFIETLEEVRGEAWISRFGSDNVYYHLAYLISEPEEKKLVWTDLKIGDIVKCKFNNVRHLVTGIHEDEKCVFFGGEWTRDKELADWEKVEE